MRWWVVNEWVSERVLIKSNATQTLFENMLLIIIEAKLKEIIFIEMMTSMLFEDVFYFKMLFSLPL